MKQETDTMNWTKEQVTTLIQEYEQHPCLYDVKNKMYYNRVTRKNALEHIVQVLEENGKITTIEEIQKKFSSLRTTYISEKRKIEAAAISNAGNDVYIPSLWYYNLMNFMNEHVLLKTSKKCDASKTKDKEEKDNASVTSKESEDSNDSVECLDESSSEDKSLIKKLIESQQTTSEHQADDNSVIEVSRIDTVSQSSQDNLHKQVQGLPLPPLAPPKRHRTYESEEIGDPVDPNWNASAELYGKYVTDRLKKIKKEELQIEVEHQIDLIFYEAMKIQYSVESR